MAIVKSRSAVLDGSYGLGFTDRMVFGQQLAVAVGAGTNTAVVVTFAEALPSAYTALVAMNQQGLPWFISTKTAFGFTVNFVGTVSAGTFDVTVIAA